MALRGLLFVFVAVSVARAQSGKKPVSLSELHARAVSEAIAEVNSRREDACVLLDRALYPYWRAENLLEFPRVWRTPLPPSLNGLKAAAEVCVDTALAALEGQQWSLGDLLRSPILEDRELWKRAVERGLATKIIRRRPDGSIEGTGRGGGTGEYGASPPPLSIDPATALPLVSGPLDPELTHKVIRNNRGQVKYCYEKSAAFSRRAKGLVAVRFSVTPEGTTGNLSLTDSTFDELALQVCVLERIATWRFPPRKGRPPVTVDYGFELGPLP